MIILTKLASLFICVAAQDNDLSETKSVSSVTGDGTLTLAYSTYMESKGA